MRRVVVTGMGIVSSIGDNVKQVKKSLWNGTSGISIDKDMIKYGFKSQISGSPKLDWKKVLDRKERRFMGAGAAWNYIAMKEAILMAGLEDNDISNIRTGIIMGSGGPSTKTLFEAAEIVKIRGPRRIGPLAVPKAMSSTNSATLATPFKIKGMSYSISSACTTSLHCIGNAVEMIQWNKQDVMFAGGGEELYWGMSCLFDAMGAMSSKHNATPTMASRTYDVNRDGFVIAGGAGVLVLEEYERAKSRGVNIIAEVTGYGATSDGYDMVVPSGEGGQRAMELALSTHKEGNIDYINPHGTSTLVGDVPEINSIRNIWGSDKSPIISATKALTGHSLGAAGVQESIYSLIMMHNNFICESANIINIDPKVSDMPIARNRKEQEIITILSNSFGFGGTNGSVIFSKYNI